MPPSVPRADQPGYYSGVPLGGIGAGCIEIGGDARFRNITINNNRTAASRIPLAPNAIAAVRAESRSGVATRILQPASSLAFDAAGIQAPYAAPGELEWYGLYPASNFRLDSTEFPLEVQWSCVAPIIPFDTTASTLPMLFSIVQFANPSEERYTVSAMLNWENLRGCTADQWPAERGRISKVCYDDNNETLFTTDAERPAYEAAPPAVLGLAFGHGEACTQNAHGDYALLCLPAAGNRVSVTGFDGNDPEALRAVWTGFAEQGALGDAVSVEPAAHCGAVCVSASLAPRTTRRFVFLFSWYCPVYRVAGADLGNAYTNELENSLAVAAQGIKHANYYQRGVANWQQRVVKSSLAPWHSRILLNSCHVFSTNTIYTRAGEFAMFESPQQPATGSLARSLYASFGTLLFYPSLAEKELELMAGAMSADAPGRPCRDLGQETLRQPSGPAAPGEMLDLNAALVLMAYRNFHLTGKTAALMNLFPKLRQALEAGLAHDRDGDGLPEGRGVLGMFPGQEFAAANSYVAGLWAPAMLAYARLARHLRQTQDIETWDARAKKAAESFDQKFWNDAAGCYRPRAAGEGCFLGQFAGPWMAELLRLDAGLSRRRLGRALETARESNQREAGLAIGGESAPGAGGDSAATEHWSWPMLSLSCVAGLQLRHADAEDGLETLNAVYRTIQSRAKRGFNQPLAWDPDRNVAIGPMQDRHIGALAVWHSLYAMLGFWMSVPEQRIVIAPRLPRGLTHFEAPLFTPVAFGTLRYECSPPPDTRRRFYLSFDSPVFIKTIEVELVRATPAPYVTLLINDEPAPIRQQILAGQPHGRLEISLQTPLQVQHPIELRVD